MELGSNGLRDNLGEIEQNDQDFDDLIPGFGGSSTSKGMVVKLGQQSIHVIVLGFSSATITEEDIRDEFKYKVKHGKEVFASTSHKRHEIKVGTILRFLVKR
ncbi:hypothetical protein LOK49_LG07G01130 [Camellia lanceoleosa]|uniref:Uncharacterized protein n=1 Tax=Camellia lanceoleosa TaxID=1840588 RepID=A0ACC0H261_9ERIC|nr:hypothetical protein LOK49_LG07G01130 [Camellia lanceoleosa]